jgi:hypothetical protein
MLRLSLFLAACAAFFSCKTAKNAAPAPASPFVALQTGGCFGYCPIFRLTAFTDGWVQYQGLQFTEKQGRDSFLLTADELARLRAKVAATNLWQYPDRIQSEVMDAPSATLMVYEAARSKSVVGSIDRPAPLLDLENAMKDLAEAHGLQVKRGVNPNAVPEANKKELIVKLRPELNAGNWIGQFSDIRLRLVRRISAENIWVVAYDANELEEKSLIELLKGTDGVLEVQANAKVQERD